MLGKTAFISGPGDSRNIFLSNAARYQVFIAVSRSGETEQVLDKARIAKNVGMTIVAFTRASANTLGVWRTCILPSMTKRYISQPKPQG